MRRVDKISHRVKDVLLPLLLGVLLPLAVFSWLAHAILEKHPVPFDLPLLWFMHGHASATWNAVMLFFTWAGSSYVLVPLCIVVIAILGQRRRIAEARFFLVAVGGAYLLNYLLKLTFSRVRPDLWISISPETGFSFPSGHTMHSMAVVAALLAVTPPSSRTWALMTGGACFLLFVGMSRIYLGVHYPSDVMAAWAASLAWVMGCRLVMQPGRNNFRQFDRP